MPPYDGIIARQTLIHFTFAIIAMPNLQLSRFSNVADTGIRAHDADFTVLQIPAERDVNDIKQKKCCIISKL